MGKFSIILALFLMVLFLPAAWALEPPKSITLDINGSCMEYNVTVSPDMFDYGCYDVKIDVTTANGRVGQIYDPMQGWKSSLYYVTDGMCLDQDNNNATFQIYAATKYEELNFKCKLRAGDKIWESEYYTIQQTCPEPPAESIEVILIVSLIAIVVLLVGITAYIKILK